MSVKPYEYDKERWETIVSDCGITCQKHNITPAISPEGMVLGNCHNGTLHFRNKHGFEAVAMFAERVSNSNTAARWLSIGFASKKLEPIIRQLCCHHHLLPPESPDAPLVTPSSQEDPC